MHEFRSGFGFMTIEVKFFDQLRFFVVGKYGAYDLEREREERQFSHKHTKCLPTAIGTTCK